MPEGKCISIYGDEVIAGDRMQTWTRNFVLRKWNSTACQYEICVLDEKEYLLMEWKSGDYIWGGRETDYYIFQRKNCDK